MPGQSAAVRPRCYKAGTQEHRLELEQYRRIDPLTAETFDVTATHIQPDVEHPSDPGRSQKRRAEATSTGGP